VHATSPARKKSATERGGNCPDDYGTGPGTPYKVRVMARRGTPLSPRRTPRKTRDTAVSRSAAATARAVEEAAQVEDSKEEDGHHDSPALPGRPLRWDPGEMAELQVTPQMEREGFDVQMWLAKVEDAIQRR
jgi:hypothetical protein